ncbi:MAG TPA: hypothetical protein VM533_02365 [Fimbriiglobus sp.]|jgi:hypothetical protein|nr:hypothetical protein [Fimbriiglobus sp.]
MNLEEFAQLVSGLSGMSHVEKIKHFAWFILTQEGRDRFGTTDIRRCYEKLHLEPPANISSHLRDLAEKKPRELLKDAKGFRLEARIKDQLDGKYALRPATISVDAMLQGLPGKVSDEAERLFLSEALTCFRNRAFRATIVMTWNLAYDHLLNWILPNHLTAFNAAIGRRYPKMAGDTVSKRDDFAEFKEFEVIEICGTAGIISSNLKKILNEKLDRRNMAAHPSLVEIDQYKAEDTISDLVKNVILKLT